MAILTCRPVEILIVDYFKKLLVSASVDAASPPINPPLTTSLPKNLLELTLGQLGGDSLAAMRLSGLLREHLQTDITADFILQQRLGKVLESVGGSRIDGKNIGEQFPGFADDVHEVEGICWGDEISMDDLGLESLCQGQGTTRRREAIQGAVVLLTGATGFLGRFILLELLQNRRCNRIYCLVKEREGLVMV